MIQMHTMRRALNHRHRGESVPLCASCLERGIEAKATNDWPSCGAAPCNAELRPIVREVREMLRNIGGAR